MGAQIPPHPGATALHFHHHNTSSHWALQKGTPLKLTTKIHFYCIIDTIIAIQGRDLLFCILHFLSQKWYQQWKQLVLLVLWVARQRTVIALLSPAGRDEDKSNPWWLLDSIGKKLQMPLAAQLSQVILYSNTAYFLLHKFFPVPLKELDEAKEEK